MRVRRVCDRVPEPGTRVYVSSPMLCLDRDVWPVQHPLPRTPSSADAHLRFPDGSGLPQTPRWDEPQRARALEQICGVFRVDLGHMRSLRLFFR